MVILILDAHKGILQLIRRIIDYISVTIEAVSDRRSMPRRLKILRMVFILHLIKVLYN